MVYECVVWPALNCVFLESFKHFRSTQRIWKSMFKIMYWIIILSSKKTINDEKSHNFLLKVKLFYSNGHEVFSLTHSCGFGIQSGKSL